MSDSIPQKTTNPDKRPPRPTSSFRSRRDRDTPWFVTSLLVHAAILAVLWFTPVRKLIFAPRDLREFQVTARAERIEEMVEHLREREANVMDQYLQQLYDIEEAIQAIRTNRMEQFEALAEELMVDAPAKALKAQEEALKAQGAALAAEEHLADQPPANAEPVFNEISEAQADAGDAQRDAVQALAFTSPFFDAAREAQSQATEAQTRTAEKRDRALEQSRELADVDRQVRDTARRENDEKTRVEREQKRVADMRDRLTKTEESQTQAEQKRQEIQQRLELARTERDAAVQEAEAAVQVAQNDKTDGARRKASDLKRKADGATRKVEGVERELVRAEATVKDQGKRMEQARAQVADAQRRLDEAAAKAEMARVAAVEAVAGMDALRETVRRAQAEARQGQVEARMKQDDARERLKEAIAAAASADNSALRKVPDAVVLPATTFVKGVVDSAADIPAIYQTAIAAEHRIAETYKQVHATQVAMIRRVPVPDALAETVVPETARPKLNERLLRAPVRTAEGAEAHRAEVDRAGQEMSAIVTAAYRLFSMARGDEASDGDALGGMSLSLAAVKAAGEREAALRELAAEDEQKRFKDLSAAMREDGAAASGAGSTPGKSSLVRDPFPDPGQSPEDIVPGRVIVSSGTRPRVMVADGPDKPVRWVTPKWLYVDSWYTIGPFPNPGRRNIDTQFPPESVIDLDASYAGKEGRRVKWEFVSAGRAGIFPANDEEYGIYYAYTELWFDEAMDLTVAVGSDDNSRLWINRDPVWISGRELKSWRANEGFRTVHFKQGLNRVLYRVENGWRETLYSLMICLDRRSG